MANPKSFLTDDEFQRNVFGKSLGFHVSFCFINEITRVVKNSLMDFSMFFCCP